MRLLSIEQAARGARTALVRFPLALLSAVTAAAAAMILVENPRDDTPVMRVMLTALLGLPLTVALATTLERRAASAARRVISSAAIAIALIGFWYASRGWKDVVLVTHYFHVEAAGHLMVAVLPFIGFATGYAFWQYNRTLFLRFLLATLYTVVLFAGLAIALVAIDNLFGVNIDSQIYMHLWILLALVFHPWFFLGGVPRDIDVLETRADYPAGLKIFAQFVLIPVVTVYLVILTAYLVRVVVTRTWPSGWIGWLVSSVATAGTLALLLVHPVRERTDSRWVDAYGRWFYVALLPSIGMLLMAIWQRIEQYGITERRYFLAVLALWLLAIALFYAITASRNIRVIPLTLCLVALVTLAGPWSAYAVSRASQAGRLRAILERNEVLAGGRLLPPAREVSREDRREIAGAIRYLVDTHGPETLARVAPELQETAEAAIAGVRPELTVDDPATRAVMAVLGIEYVDRWAGASADEWVSFDASRPATTVDIAGYDRMAQAVLTDSTTIRVDDDTLTLSFTKTPPMLIVARSGDTIATIPLQSLLDRAREVHAARQSNRVMPQIEPVIIDADGDGIRIRLVIWRAMGRSISNGPLEATSIEADVLIDMR